MSEYEVRNAKIEATHLGVSYSDHGVLSFAIALSGEWWAQSYGTIILDDVNPRIAAGDHSAKPTRIPTTLGSSLLLAVDECWGVDWEKLPGLPCRAWASNGDVYAIGHYLKDKWLWLDRDKMAFVVTTFKAIRPREPRP